MLPQINTLHCQRKELEHKEEKVAMSMIPRVDNTCIVHHAVVGKKTRLRMQRYLAVKKSSP